MDPLVDGFLKGYAAETRRAYARHLAQFTRIIGHSRWGEVRAHEVDRYIAHIAQQGYSPQSRRARYIALRSFARYLARTHRIHLPVEGLPAITSRTEPIIILSPEDVQKLLTPQKRFWGHRLHEERNVAICALLWATGITAVELCALNLGDVAQEDAKLYVAGRVVPIYPGALHLVVHYVDHVRAHLSSNHYERALFLTYKGTRMRLCTCVRMLKDHGRRRGISCSARTLRHTFAMHLLREGADKHAVQQFLGAQTVDSRQRYVRALQRGGKKS